MSLAISYGHAAVVRCLLDTPAYQIGLVSETRPGFETFKLSSFDEKGRTYLTHASTMSLTPDAQLELIFNPPVIPQAVREALPADLHVRAIARIDD